MSHACSCLAGPAISPLYAQNRAPLLPGPHPSHGAASLSVLRRFHPSLYSNLHRHQLDCEYNRGETCPRPGFLPQSSSPLPTRHQSNRSTKTWIVPPQERPIFSKFSSSEIPNSSICGFPSLITSIAASTTAGSTQPP